MVDLDDTFVVATLTLNLSVALDMRRHAHARYGELDLLCQTIEQLTENDDISWECRRSLKSELKSLKKQRSDYLALHDKLWMICDTAMHPEQS